MSELSERLAELGVEIESKYDGLRSFSDKDKLVVDHWTCTITYKGKTMVVPSYKSGLEHRKLRSTVKKVGSKYMTTMKDILSDEQAANQGLTMPVKPNVADVMSCLLNDASNGEETFSDYCSEFGLSEDSRSALNDYLQSQRVLMDMRRVFGQSLWQQLRQLEH